MLHAEVVVEAAHVDVVRALGLTVETFADNQVGFRQPCALFKNECCTVYARRPAPCQTYRCALLRKHESGDVTLDEAMSVVRRTKELVLSDAERQAVATDPGLALRAAALDVMLNKHFRRKTDAPGRT